jgi:hypothetical protein
MSVRSGGILIADALPGFFGDPIDPRLLSVPGARRLSPEDGTNRTAASWSELNCDRFWMIFNQPWVTSISEVALT